MTRLGALTLGLLLTGCATSKPGDDPAVKAADEAAYSCSRSKLREYSMAVAEPAETVAAAAFQACYASWTQYVDLYCARTNVCDPVFRRDLLRAAERSWGKLAISLIVEERARATSAIPRR